MSVAYLVGSLVGALVVLDGIWMAANARPLLPIPRWNYPSTPAALRWMGVAETIGGTGIAAGFGVLAASGPIPAAVYIVILAWWASAWRTALLGGSTTAHGVRFQTDLLPTHEWGRCLCRRQCHLYLRVEVDGP